MEYAGFIRRHQKGHALIGRVQRLYRHILHSDPLMGAQKPDVPAAFLRYAVFGKIPGVPEPGGCHPRVDTSRWPFLRQLKNGELEVIRMVVAGKYIECFFGRECRHCSS